MKRYVRTRRDGVTSGFNAQVNLFRLNEGTKDIGSFYNLKIGVIKMKNLVVTIEHEENNFRIEKKFTFHGEHSSQKSVVANLEMIKKELRRILKTSKFMLTTEWYDSNDYKHYSVKRYIVDKWRTNDMFSVDYRPLVNGHFPEQEHIYKKTLLGCCKFVVNDIENDICSIIGELPVDETYFGLSLKK